MSSKSLGVLGEEIKQQTNHQHLWKYVPPPRQPSITPMPVAHILVYVTYTQAYILWKAVTQQPITGPTQVYHFFFMHLQTKPWKAASRKLKGGVWDVWLLMGEEGSRHGCVGRLHGNGFKARGEREEKQRALYMTVQLCVMTVTWKFMAQRGWKVRLKGHWN